MRTGDGGGGGSARRADGGGVVQAGVLLTQTGTQTGRVRKQRVEVNAARCGGGAQTSDW